MANFRNGRNRWDDKKTKMNQSERRKRAPVSMGGCTTGRGNALGQDKGKGPARDLAYAGDKAGLMGMGLLKNGSILE